MSGSEQIHAMMAEIGPLLDLASVYEGPDGHSWVLTSQDGSNTFVDLAPDSGRLWLSAEAGTPRAEDAARLYSLLLQYNARWRETDGVRMVLDGPDGAIVQAFDLPAAEVDVPKFVTIMANFGSVLDGWRSIVLRDPAGPQNAAPTADLTAPGIVRG